MLVLLIDNDQPQRIHRREHGGPRADHDPRQPLPYLVPFVMPFPRRKMAVQHGHQSRQGTVTEARLEALDRLRCQ